jgi:hypothetical protein
VFATYVERMLARRGAATRYTREQTLRWLTWLARRLVQHNQTEFYLERMQPTYLTEQPARLRFYRLVVKACVVLLSSLLGTAIAAVISMLILLVTDLLIAGKMGDPRAYFFVPLGGALIGLFAGALIGIIHSVDRDIRPAEVVTWSWRGMGQRLRRSEVLKNVLFNGISYVFLSTLLFAPIAGASLALFAGLFSVLVIGPINGLVSAAAGSLLSVASDQQSSILPGQKRRPDIWRRLLVGFPEGLIAGLLSLLFVALINDLLIRRVDLLFPLFAGLLSLLIAGLTIAYKYGAEIEKVPLKRVAWLWIDTWRKVVKSEALKNGLFMALLTGLLIVVISGPGYGPGLGLIFGLVIAPFCWLVSDIIGDVIDGLSSNLLEERMLTRPNEGIYNSAHNGIIVGLSGGSIAGLLIGALAVLMLSLVSNFLGGLTFGLLIALVVGLSTGLTIGLANGGTACIQYFVLRLFLWRSGYAPLDYVRFLDYAAERILLRKVGGGYIFAHRILLDYFISLDIPKESMDVDPLSLPPQQQSI